MENEKYFSRSWAMLTRDKGWIKPILVMAVAQLVPIAGYIGAKGYMLEWARLTAWGVAAAPKQKNVETGAPPIPTFSNTGAFMTRQSPTVAVRFLRRNSSQKAPM